MSENNRRKPNTQAKTQAPKAAPRPQSSGTAQPRRRTAPKRNDGFSKLIVRTAVVAAIAVLVVILGLMLSGLRYSKATSNDGTTAKFFGWVDDAGNIDKGTLYFSGNGSGTAKINAKKSSISYSNGDVYVGEMANGFPNGQGKMTYSNGDIYEGSYVNGIIEGKGKFSYAGGDVYEGDFKDGGSTGTGIYTEADGTFVRSARRAPQICHCLWHSLPLQSACCFPDASFPFRFRGTSPLRYPQYPIPSKERLQTNTPAERKHVSLPLSRL